MACSGFRGSIYITIMELGPQNHNGDGLSGPNSIIVVYMDPLGIIQFHETPTPGSLIEPVKASVNRTYPMKPSKTQKLPQDPIKKASESL